MKKVIFLLIAILSIATVFAQSSTSKKHRKHKTVATTKSTATTTSATTTTSVNADEAKAAVSATPTATTKAPVEFAESKHSFGKIKQGTPVTHVFSFVNSSAGPVIIENATAQCGCTTPEYPKSPIAKGGKGEIKVTYNAAAIGNFTKQVTVRVAKYDTPIMLTIDGEVLAPAAPAEEKKEPGK